MLSNIYQSNTSCFIGGNKTFFFCNFEDSGKFFFLKLDWNLQIIDKISSDANNYFIHRNQLFSSKNGTILTTIYDVDNLNNKKLIPLDLIFLPFFFYENFYLGPIQYGDKILLDLNTKERVKDFGLCGCWNYIHGGKKLLLFNTQPSKIYDDSSVCSYLRVLDFNSYSTIWAKDLYDYCFYDVLYSSRNAEGAPHVVMTYQDNLLLHFKKHILCLNIENGETIWHREDRYQEVEVVENRCFLYKPSGYEIVDVNTGQQLQDFIKYPKIVDDINSSVPTNGESRFYKGFIWRTTRYEREGNEILLVIKPETGEYVHIEKIPTKSMLNEPKFIDDKVILTSRAESEFFIYQITDFDTLA